MLFAFCYGPVLPFVTSFHFDQEGKKSADVPIFLMAKPSFLHDFVVTEWRAVFPDIQIIMKPIDMVLGSGAPVGSNPEKVTRLGVLPCYATLEAKMRWFEVPGVNPIHAVNAWEDDGGRTLFLVAPNVLSVKHALDWMDLVHEGTVLWQPPPSLQPPSASITLLFSLILLLLPLPNLLCFHLLQPPPTSHPLVPRPSPSLSSSLSSSSSPFPPYPSFHC